MGGVGDWVERAFWRLAEDTPARVSVVRQVGRDVVFEWVSPSAANGLGFEPDELVGRSFSDIYPPDAAADVAANIARAAGTGGHSYERVRDLPGGRQTVHVDVLPLGEGRFVLSSLDLSAEREAERRLDEVARTVSIGIYHWNVRDGQLWWSDELYRILGYEPGEVEATIATFLERVHPDDRDHVADRTEEARRRGLLQSNRHRVVLTDGTVRFVEGRSQVATEDGGELLYIVGTVQDISDRVAAERDAELHRQAIARQRTALELHDGIVQRLVTVWLALDLGDIEQARQATRIATENAQQVVAELLSEFATAEDGPGPGDLAHGRDPVGPT